MNILKRPTENCFLFILKTNFSNNLYKYNSSITTYLQKVQCVRTRLTPRLGAAVGWQFRHRARLAATLVGDTSAFVLSGDESDGRVVRSEREVQEPVRQRLVCHPVHVVFVCNRFVAHLLHYFVKIADILHVYFS